MTNTTPIIAIDYTPAVEQGGGIGRLVREQIAALAHHDTITAYRLFVAGATLAALPPSPGDNFEWRSTPVAPIWWARLWHRARVPLPVTWLTGGVDLYHATDFVLPPVPRRVKTLVTIHDLSFARVPEAAAPRLKAYLDRVVPRSIRRAQHMIADSAATKADIVALYGAAPERISVVLSGVDARFQRIVDPHVLLTIRKKYNIGTAPFVLCVGTVQPRKNYSRMIEALARLRANGHRLELVIAGGKGWLEDAMYQTIARTGMQPYVHLVGFVADADLPTLYSAAECFAFPSLYEGFGLPILESMACGTPVITANTSSLPEVAGDAALLVDPHDGAALAAGIARILTDATLRAALIARGYEQIKAFTWANAARQLHEIYYNVWHSSLGQT